MAGYADSQVTEVLPDDEIDWYLLDGLQDVTNIISCEEDLPRGTHWFMTFTNNVCETHIS